MKVASRFFPYVALTVLTVAVLWLLVPVAAFSPPSSVPYSAAAYADRAKLRNATGMISLAAYASPAACPAQANLFSQNISYSVPVLSLPGRAGLGLTLTLSYNSKVWVKSGTTIYFDGDKGWPAPGWRLGFGRIDGKYTGPDGYDHYYLISGEGSVRDLRYNSSSGLYESRDSSYIDFNESTGVLRHKDGTQVTYQLVGGTGGFVVPTQIKDRNGNYITIAYSGTGQNISSITDTVGRTTTFSYNGDNTLASISKSGFGGASRTWSFTYKNETLSYDFGSLTVNGPTSGSQVKVLEKITYPNGTHQLFTYNGYAQLTEAAFRSSSSNVRGKFIANWQSTPGGGWTDSPTPASVAHYDGSATNTWTLAFNSYSTTVTDPASVPRTTTFIQTGQWDDGLPSQTTLASPTLRTSLTEWENDGTGANPRVFRVTNTLNDSSQQAKTEYSYTSYNNASEAREYDFGFTLRRKTATTYLTGTNYTTRHILTLPETVIVYDGGGTAKSRTTYSYDQGSIGSATGASGHDDTNYGTGFSYRGNVTTVTRYTDAATPSGAITNTSTYDMLGNMLTESADCCVTKTYNYSSTTQYSQPDSIVRGSVTTLTTSSTYDSYTGLVATSTDENSKTTTYNYDVADRITTVTRPDSTAITTSYDDASATASTTSVTPIETSKNLKRTTESDGLGRTKRVIAKDNADTIYSKVDTLYDSVGRTWKVSNPYTGASASYWTETQYDAIGRPVKVIPPDGTGSINNIVYAYSGDTTTITDQTGKQRKTKSDALGRQIETVEPDPDNNNSLTLSTTYTYDVMDNVTQISQGVQTRSFVFDGLGRKTSETTPEAGTVSYTYNNDGLVTTRTDARGVVTTYTYDTALNRLTSVSYNVSCCSSTVPATGTVSYTYGTDAASNNKGRVTQMTDGAGQENYTYDTLGRTTQVQKIINNVTYTTAYTYNLAGEVVTMTYPSGRVVKQNYDNIGRLASVQNNTTSAYYASNIGYNTSNQVTGFTFGNSATATYGYSAQRLQMTSMVYTKGSTLLSLTYNYSQSGNNNGQIASITDNLQAGRTVTYSYDSLHRAKTAVTNGSASYPKWGLSWTYDRYGNRTVQTVTHGTAPSNTVSVNTANNRITSMGGFTFYYDANGNLTQDDLYKYKYDAESRLVEIRNLSDVLISTYAYDGHSLRVVKIVGADRTISIYSGTQLISEFEDAASATYSSGTTPGQAVADSAALLLYQHGDHLTTRLTTENSGTVANEQAHYPYGESWYATGQADPSVIRKFTNYTKDDEVSTGQLKYATFRQHAARIGRFQGADSQGSTDPADTNSYAYGSNDPINLPGSAGISSRVEKREEKRRLCETRYIFGLDLGFDLFGRPVVIDWSCPWFLIPPIVALLNQDHDSPSHPCYVPLTTAVHEVNCAGIIQYRSRDSGNPATLQIGDHASPSLSISGFSVSTEGEGGGPVAADGHARQLVAGSHRNWEAHYVLFVNQGRTGKLWWTVQYDCRRSEGTERITRRIYSRISCKD